jgi:K+-transporting ATPase c subunit
VAKARGISTDQLGQLVAQYTKPRVAGSRTDSASRAVFNVLKLNLALS